MRADFPSEEVRTSELLLLLVVFFEFIRQGLSSSRTVITLTVSTVRIRAGLILTGILFVGDSGLRLTPPDAVLVSTFLRGLLCSAGVALAVVVLVLDLIELSNVFRLEPVDGDGMLVL